MKGFIIYFIKIKKIVGKIKGKRIIVKYFLLVKILKFLVY